MCVCVFVNGKEVDHSGNGEIRFIAKYEENSYGLVSPKGENGCRGMGVVVRWVYSIGIVEKV